MTLRLPGIVSLPGHVTEVHRPGLNLDSRRWHYFSCECGVCGPPRASLERARRDRDLHIGAVAERAAA